MDQESSASAMHRGSSVQARRVLYRGWVQGVGFRYTARRLAQSYQVTGFVRNLPDGQVELVVEGPKAEIESFLQAVQQAMSGYIRGSTVQPLEPTGRYASFEIVH
jgi:acylphosphatase